MKAEFDNLPKTVRQAIQNSRHLGADIPSVIRALKKGPAKEMVDRLKRADLALDCGHNMLLYDRAQLSKAGTILKGIDASGVRHPAAPSPENK